MNSEAKFYDAIRGGKLLGPTLDDTVAAQIMRRGMQESWFTGKSFASYLPGSGPATTAQYTAARRIINGQDCAAEIAGYAKAFEAALQAGGWA